MRFDKRIRKIEDLMRFDKRIRKIEDLMRFDDRKIEDLMRFDDHKGALYNSIEQNKEYEIHYRIPQPL